jgi:hypothetical protein
MSDFDNIAYGPDSSYEYPPRSSTEFEIPLPSPERIAQILEEVAPSIESITGRKSEELPETELRKD